MRLTKIIKALKQRGIFYEYTEKTYHGNVFAEVRFRYGDKKYSVDEISSNSGNKPMGIFTNLNNFESSCTQSVVADYIINRL